MSIARVYLAGKMRGVPMCNFPAFLAAAANLRERGYEVFNPAEKDLADGFDPSNDEPRELSYYLAVDLPEVLRADGVVLLPGWETSDGCMAEIFNAMFCKIPVLEYPDLQPVVPFPAFAVFQAVVEIMRMGAGKHIRNSWYIEPQDNHLDKGMRHCLTAKLIRDGNQKPDGEAHLKLACCRLAMALTQQIGLDVMPAQRSVNIHDLQGV